jgi:DNA processing protein
MTPLNEPAHFYYAALSHWPFFSPMLLAGLLAKLGSAQALWQASPPQLKAAGLTAGQIKQLAQLQSSYGPAQHAHMLDKLAAAGGRFLLSTDSEFPPLLRHIPHPPLWLYVRGPLLPTAQQICLAVVGTRQATAYGLEMTRNLVGPLAAAGIIIVSGLANGIDSEAHSAALAANGNVIAVLAGGLDQLPKEAERADLIRQVSAQGTLVSEHPLGVAPHRSAYGHRNRLISGLAMALLVVEAGAGSGALITANHALEQGRDVLAVPGMANWESSAGTNELIRQGAAMITRAEDLWAALGLPPTQLPTQLPASPLPGKVAPPPSPSHNKRTLIPAKSKAPKTEPPPPSQPSEAQLAGLDATARALLHAIAAAPRNQDELARACQLASNEAAASLTMLELAGLVATDAQLRYRLADTLN